MNFFGSSSRSLLETTGMLMMALGVALTAVNAQNTTFIKRVCNGQTIPSGDPFFLNLGNLLVDLKDNTASNGYNYSSRFPAASEGITAYGLGLCNSSLLTVPESQCTNCLRIATNEIWSICGNAIGARIQLEHCYVRYDQFDFGYDTS